MAGRSLTESRRPKVVQSWASGGGMIETNTKDCTDEFHVHGTVNADVVREFAEDGGKIKRTGENDKFAVYVGEKGAAPVPNQTSRQDINITVRGGGEVKRLRLSVFERVGVIWEKIGCSQGHQKLVNSGKVLEENKTLHESGVKESDVISVVTEQTVVTSVPGNSGRVH